jgi:hypothetical protein
MGDVRLERAGPEEPAPGRPAGGRQAAAVDAAAGGGATGALPVSSARVAEVAREVIGRLAPQELAVFDAMADRWLSGDLPRRGSGRMPGAAVGFGVGAVLLSELVFPIVTGAIGEVLGAVAVERIRPRRRSARPRAEPQVTPPDASAGTTGARTAGERPGADVRLTAQQMHDLHDACRRHAMTLGLPPGMAVLLADAVVGALHSAPEGP